MVAVSSLIIPASIATERASPEAFEISVGVVIDENQLTLQAKLNAPEVAEIMSCLRPSAVSYTHLTLPTIYSV